MMGKWLLLLGANSDIAVATARRFAQAGWNIFLASRNLEELSKEAANLSLRYGVQAKEIYFDALDFASHDAFYKALEPKPDGVILAFGLLRNQMEAQKDFNLSESIIDSNYTGAVSILEIVAGDFESRKCGFIVGISSVAGDRGRASNYIYGSAKAGFTAYLSGLRHRLFKSGVHVMTVKPGFVATKMTAGMDLPLKLLASPGEVAEAIYSGAFARRNTIYAKKIWRMIMLIITHLPDMIFKKSKL